MNDASTAHSAPPRAGLFLWRASRALFARRVPARPWAAGRVLAACCGLMKCYEAAREDQRETQDREGHFGGKPSASGSNEALSGLGARPTGSSYFTLFQTRMPTPSRPSIQLLLGADLIVSVSPSSVKNLT